MPRNKTISRREVIVGESVARAWAVHIAWHDVTQLASINGGFNFIDKNGREVRTTAGMNCWAIKDAAKTS